MDSPMGVDSIFLKTTCSAFRTGPWAMRFEVFEKELEY
jgi:hypothetical protein